MEALTATLSDVLHGCVHPSARAVSGGSIHSSYRLESDLGPLFVKTGPLNFSAMFAAEAAGLAALSATNTVRIPNVLACGTTARQAYLCLEWLELSPAPRRAESTLGELLAQLHRVQAREHGWDRDNFIGATSQANRREADWVRFYREQRLLPQIELARGNGADAQFVERALKLAERVDAFFSQYRPTPSLLHGDLWSGNWGALPDATPVIYDPAVYYGDREADIAMTLLFGGFGPDFYASYQSVWPLDEDANRRAPLYNLYHVLNHFNLFGGGYLSQARSMIDRLLAEIR